MFFGRYQIVVIKEKTGSSRTLYLNSWIFIALFSIFIFLIAGNIYFSQFIKENRILQSYVENTQGTLEASQNQLLEMAGEVLLVRESLERIQQFNSKLSLMANLEQEQIAENVGGLGQDFNIESLPLHRQELASSRILSYLEELSIQARLEEVLQQELLLGMRENEHMLAAMPSIIPVEGFITSHFGYRQSPFSSATTFHKGMDIAAPTGTDIIAPANGIVTMVEYDGAYGNCIMIDHGSGIVTKYAHMHDYNVEVGDVVERHQVIGFVGSTGRSTGPHLHYEVILNGVETDPRLYIVME